MLGSGLNTEGVLVRILGRRRLLDSGVNAKGMLVRSLGAKCVSRVLVLGISLVTKGACKILSWTSKAFWANTSKIFD